MKSRFSHDEAQIICFQDHFPTFLSNYESLKKKDVKSVVCVSVNDPFVMEAFGKEMKAEGKVINLIVLHFTY